MRWGRLLWTSVAVLLCVGLPRASAQELKLKPDGTSKLLSLGAPATIEVDGLKSNLDNGKHKLSDFVLYLDGYKVATVADGALSDIAHNKIAFDLERSATNKSEWIALLGSPTAFQKNVRVDVGITGESGVLPTTTGKSVEVALVVVSGWGLVVGFVFLLAAACAMVALGSVTDFLRDSQPTDFGGAEGPNGAALRRPFSLAQSQMAWWFALVIAAFIFLYLLTGDFNTLTNQALTLMGIGTGTALGAVMVEKTKSNPVLQNFTQLLAQISQSEAARAAPAELSALYAKRDELARRLASQNFLVDILTDVDGVCLHRFQIMAWTLVIGVVFCIGVYRNLALPSFDGTILAVLGISAGTYLGFKVPEQPN